jgi:methylated-DNA-[protein]-cysteine S-methyltransferase
MYSSIIESPIGKIIIKATEKEVNTIQFIEHDEEENPNRISELAQSQLSEYFEGKRKHFDFHMDQSGSEFQTKVWLELQNISIGNTISYATLAKRMENPLAIRAIAAANGKNNLLLVVPCHRVIGSSGKLVGYSAGLWRKKWLLEHETRMTMLGQSFLDYKF